jgi:NitT/TauT family transport system ATP-binding protein
MAILTLRNVSKAFGDPDNGSDQVVAMNDVSLDVSAGEFYSLIGPSGCGKSTLLRIIGGLIPASDGELIVSSEPVNGPHPRIGVVVPEESTFPWRTTFRDSKSSDEFQSPPSQVRLGMGLAVAIYSTC